QETDLCVQNKILNLSDKCNLTTKCFINRHVNVL
ncbi:unnamed protein product, partial [Musa acuminata subsp. malaccensis]